jgi:uncharacterized protein
MSAAVFVDSGAWIALAAPDDRWHSDARACLSALVRRRLPLVTTNHVVGETYAWLVRASGHATAWRFKRELDDSRRIELVTTDEKLEREAWEILRKYDDQAFSFVDAVSFALMRRRRMRRAFAFDQHFAAAGFERVPLDATVD